MECVQLYSEGFKGLSKEACGVGLSLGLMYYEGAPIDAAGRWRSGARDDPGRTLWS